jgi:RNase P subunit RPR2
MAKPSSPHLDIPLVTCPDCEKRRPMTIKSVRVRSGEGTEVEYACSACGTTERRIVRPISE